MIFNKQKTAQHIFEQIPPYYDMMNDAMSLGIHRLWKKQFLTMCDIEHHHMVLDMACGTGDIAIKMAPKLTHPAIQLHLADPSLEMLEKARARMIDNGHLAHYIQTEAEHIALTSNHFDRITIAFGLRNFHDISKALDELYRILKPTGKLNILEFSTPVHPAAKKAYDLYKDHVIPKIGSCLAKDRQSYEYLAESINNHPPQQELLDLIKTAGFQHSNYNNLSNGIVAVHYGYKH